MGEGRKKSSQHRMEIGREHRVAWPQKLQICHCEWKHPSKNFQRGILGCLHLLPRLLLAMAGASDANCHHEFLDLHTEHYDIILEEYKEIGEDRSLQSCCESRDKQTQSEPDNFPFNWFKLGIAPTSKLFSN